jgi:hypothetical protein
MSMVQFAKHRRDLTVDRLLQNEQVGNGRRTRRQPEPTLGAHATITGHTAVSRQHSTAFETGSAGGDAGIRVTGA